MAQLLSSPITLPADVDHHVVAFPTRPAASFTTRFPPQWAGCSAADAQGRLSAHVIGDVVVLEVAGLLRDVVDVLDQTIQLALAEGPRGVVCDLSAVIEGADPAAVEALASAGRHVRDWPGIPVVIACPDPAARAAMAAHPMCRHLIMTASTSCAVSAVLATPTPAVRWLRLAPHPSATHSAREFVTCALLDWGLDPLILSADLVVSELVTSATMQDATGVNVSIAWNLRALRVTVRDSSPDVPRQRYTHFDLYGSRLTAIAGLSRAFGVLPTADGGKVLWAVLNATPNLARVPLFAVSSHGLSYGDGA